MANGNTVTEGLLLRMEATPGREEPKTTAWFAIRMGPGTFGIFDVLLDVVGREAHLSGGVARAPQHDAALFADPPGIQRMDVLASGLPE